MKIEEIKTIVIGEKSILLFGTSSEEEAIRIKNNKNDPIFILVNSLIASNQIKIKYFSFGGFTKFTTKWSGVAKNFLRETIEN